MLQIRTLRSIRAASFTEYAALSGLLSVAAIGAALNIGPSVVQGTERGTSALAGAFHTAEADAPAPVDSTLPGGVGGVGGDGGGEVEPPPPHIPAECYAGLETLWNWSPLNAWVPATTDPKGLLSFQTGDLSMGADCGYFPDPLDASYASFGSFSPALAGAGPYTTHAPFPYDATSGYRIAGLGQGQGVDVSFQQLVSGLEFYIHDLDGLEPTPALYDSQGRLVRQASGGYRDLVYVAGLAPDGSTVYPTVSGVGVSNGEGVFAGLANRNCDTWDSDCTARFEFTDSVVGVRIMKIDGGVFDISDLKGMVAKP